MELPERLLNFNLPPFNFQSARTTVSIGLIHIFNLPPAPFMALYIRFAATRVSRALLDTRVVLLSGPRQAGKTTLAKQIAGRSERLTTEDDVVLTSGDGIPLTLERLPFFTLDDLTTRDTILSDPVGFIRRLDRAVIDEVQRVPDVLLAIKESVDSDPRPGRFLLTGSSNLMTAPRIADSLAGRMETVSLLPLAQSELRGTLPAFFDQAFAGAMPHTDNAIMGDDLIAIVLAGGYPEALTRASGRRRSDWYLNYIDAIVGRDVRDIADVEQLQQMPRLLRALAHYSGQLVNYSAVGRMLGMNHTTTRKYTDIFTQLFLVTMLQPWHDNALRRLTKAPKLHFLDSGLLAALRDVSAKQLVTDRAAFGALLETFIVTELLKSASWSDDRLTFFYFRDQDQDEVDIIVEDQRGRVIGIEVKAAATVTRSDFKGLRKLATACGNRFVLGMVLYDHHMTVPFGDQFAAVPLSAVWS
jgi:predicted AAA+ superfamily ATPase